MIKKSQKFLFLILANLKLTCERRSHHENEREKQVMCTIFFKNTSEMFTIKSKIRNALVQSQSTNNRICYHCFLKVLSRVVDPKI